MAVCETVGVLASRRRQPASERQTDCLTLRFLFAYALTLWRKARRYELTHFTTEHGTPSGSESMGLVQPGLDCLLWVPRNAPALALLPATTTLGEKTGSLPGRCKPNQPSPPSAFRERTRGVTIILQRTHPRRARLYLFSTDRTRATCAQDFREIFCRCAHRHCLAGPVFR